MEFKGQKIKFVETEITEIDEILRIERSNEGYVRQDDLYKHVGYIKSFESFHFTIKTINDNRIIGYVILFCSEIGNVELRRIVICDKGKGYGRESLKLLKKICFEKMNSDNIWLEVYDYNTTAIKLYESEGFLLKNVFREQVENRTSYRTIRNYFITKSVYNLYTYF